MKNTNNEKIINFIKEHYDECAKSALAVRDYLLASPVAFHGRCVQTLHIPKIFSREDIENFRGVVDGFYPIFDKIVRTYIEDEAYRRLFPFDKRLEELILADCGYDVSIPIMRMDIFYNERTEDYKFCEINTDGTSAMIEDMQLALAFERNNIPREILGKLRCFELFDTWVREVGSIYRKFENRRKNPRVVIADFLDKAYLPEFEEFVKRFEKYGYAAKICDVRALKYRGGVLYDADGERVDIIYRRAVTVDIMAEYDACTDFIAAYKDKAVCVLGAFRTQIIHHKALFYILHSEQTKRLLTTEENELVERHIPYTARLCDADIDKICADKDRYIIKPSDSYASRGVFAGVDFSADKWRRTVGDCSAEDYIVQEYCTPYKTPNIYLAEEGARFKDYSNLTGLYVYGGGFAGVYSRLSDGGIISSQYNEKSTVTFVADKA